MKKLVAGVGLALIAGGAAFAQNGSANGKGAWPAWRGPLANGVAPDADPPVTWSESQNIRWKVAVPGKGHASPIVWNDRVLVATAVPTDKPAAAEKKTEAANDVPEWSKRTARLPENVLQFTVLALRRQDGVVIWSRAVCEELPPSATHGDGSWASGSPVTDGERLYAYFGSDGLYCLDMDGNPKWEKRLGTMRTRASFGEGASPALCGNMIVVNWDGENGSFITALDKITGAEKWKAARAEKSSWATPLVVVAQGHTQIVVSATGKIRGYDPANGRVLWECGGLTENVIPSPVFDGENAICMSGFRGSSLLAVRLAGAEGDITGKPGAIAWTRSKDTPYVPSPLLYDKLLYYLKVNSASLSCVETSTGETRYEKQSLPGLKQVYASPVGAAGRVYVTSREGVTAVIRRGPTFELIATNKLDESFTASGAIAGKELYLRGQKSLYCIAGP